MKLGIAFPTNEIGNDPIRIRDFAQGAEDLGYDYMFLTDHVLQIRPDDHPGAFAPYTLDDPFHEPLVTIGYLAAATEKIGLTTGILITPQRQTVLMAKQAAQADLLSNGRLRLGIGIGWQDIEFTALGEDFYNRGVRSEEQVALMRALWLNETAEFKGKWHHLPKSGFNPNSVQKPIPIWFGGMADAVVERAARIGDGWLPIGDPTDLKPKIDRYFQLAEDHGRRDKVGLEAFLSFQGVLPGSPRLDMDDLIKFAGKWQEAGATHIAVNTQRIGLASLDDHLELAKEFKDRAEAL